MIRRILLLAAVALALVPRGTEAASSINTALPAQGAYNAAPIRQNFVAAANDINALQSLNAGATAPASPGLGTSWLDTSTTPYILKTWSVAGSQWVTVAAFNQTTGLWIPPVGGGTIPSITSAATTDLGSVPQAVVNITGNQSIASFGSSAPEGQVKLLTFTGTPTLVYNATYMVLPGSINLSVSSATTILAVSLGGGRWRVGFSGNVYGPLTSTTNGLACWGDTTAHSLKDCGTIVTKNAWSNSITGAQSEDFVAGVKIVTNTNTASRLTNLAKISALYIENDFGTTPPAGEGQRTGLFAVVRQSGAVAFTSSNYQFNTPVFGYLTVSQGNTVVGTEPTYHGFGGLAEIGGTGTRAFNLHGAEFDANIGALAVVGNRIGVLAAIGAGTFASPTNATDFDGAFAIGRATAGDAAWKEGYMVRAPNGVWAFDVNSVLFGGLGASNGAGGVTAVAGTGIDLTGIDHTFQQYISDSFQIGPDGHLFMFTAFPELRLRDTNTAVTAGGLTRWTGVLAGGWCEQINTAVAGDFSTVVNSWCMAANGSIGLGNALVLATKTVGAGVNQLPACAVGTLDWMFIVNDALAPAWNAIVVGGGAAKIKVQCNGVNWIVF